jgi:hypothetical protein
MSLETALVFPSRAGLGRRSTMSVMATLMPVKSTMGHEAKAAISAEFKGKLVHDRVAICRQERS